jgi:hypothetical protein
MVCRVRIYTGPGYFCETLMIDEKYQDRKGHYSKNGSEFDCKEIIKNKNTS